MENRVVVARGYGSWVGESGYGYKRVRSREPYGGRTVLYLDCNGSYTNLHTWQNCIQPHTQTWMHAKLVKSGQVL